MTYRVPSMAEVAAVRGTNGFTVISTFSGCGGSCLGFEMAGFDVRAAVEFIPAARETYALNHPGVAIEPRDIREVSGQDLLDLAGLTEVDVLEGSPPCASFSAAGKGARGWGQVRSYSDTRQRTDDLFGEYVRLIQQLRPKVFVAENVAGLIRGKAVGYARQVIESMRSLGYNVSARLLDARWLGVPQSRQRIIFIGVRDDIGKAPIFPKPHEKEISLREALNWPENWWHVYTTGGNQGASYGAADTPHSAVTARNAHHYVALTDDPSHVVIRSGGWDDPDREMAEIRSLDAPSVIVTAIGMNGMANSQAGVIGPDPAHIVARVDGWREDEVGSTVEAQSIDRPSPIVMVSGVGGHRETGILGPDPGDWCDPETGKKLTLRGKAVGTEWERIIEGARGGRYFPNLPTAAIPDGLYPRQFTLQELRAICSFPADFQLTGTYEQRWERLGRSVPPLMMKEVAECVKEILT